MVDPTDIALIGIIVTGIGVGIALFFNIQATRQNTKSQYFEIMKELENRFHQIQELPIDDPSRYMMHVSNFAIFMERLVTRKIVPTRIVYPEYAPIFQEALFLIKKYVPEEKYVDENYDFFKFCIKNKVEAKEISSRRMKSSGITSMIFSSDEHNDADLYSCSKCLKFFGTKDEFKKHKEENSCKTKEKTKN